MREAAASAPAPATATVLPLLQLLLRAALGTTTPWAASAVEWASAAARRLHGAACVVTKTLATTTGAIHVLAIGRADPPPPSRACSTDSSPADCSPACPPPSPFSTGCGAAGSGVERSCASAAAAFAPAAAHRRRHHRRRCCSLHRGVVRSRVSEERAAAVRAYAAAHARAATAADTAAAAPGGLSCEADQSAALPRGSTLQTMVVVQQVASAAEAAVAPPVAAAAEAAATAATPHQRAG